MTCSGSPGLVAVGSEVNPGSPSSVSQLPCACCPSEPGQSGPVGWGGTPRRGPTTNGRLPCSLALGGTLRSVGGHTGVVRELQGRDLSGPGVARLLQKWDPEPHPGAPSPGAKQHRSGRGGGGVCGFGAGCGGPCTLLVLRSRTSLPGWLPSAVGTTGPPPMAGALRSWGTLGIMSSPERHE